MFKVNFYSDADGKEPVKEYIDSLIIKNNKESRIKLNKIHEYIQILSQFGTRAGEPYVKHINGKLWELRPLRNRIFFFYWQDNEFILLHHFMKKTQKTPEREIKRAEKNMNDFIERSAENE